MFKAIKSVILAAMVATTFVAASDVVVLDDSSLDSTLASSPAILVEFYAPWCGHCKALEPEYEKAAAQLKDFAPKVVLAKLDATAATASAEKFEIKGFPTLKWFENGVASEYTGGRTADTIVAWIKKRMGPATQTVANKEELEKVRASAEVVVVGVFPNAEALAPFETLAKADEAVVYASAIGASADLVEALGLPAGTTEGIVLFKKFDEGRNAYTGANGDAEAIKKFIQGNSLPLIVAFNPQTAQKIFGGNVKQHLILFLDGSKQEEADAIKTAVRPVAEKTKGDYLFVTVDKTDSRVLEFFGVKPETDLPTARIVELAETGMKKFKLLEKALTAEILQASIDKHIAGEMEQDLKSEEAPASNDGDVKIITGKTFDEIVRKSGKDVFVEFYAPWCGHCKSLAPIWDKLGAHYKAAGKDVIIAKIDGTANEVKGVAIQGFPTLKLFQAGVEAPVDYEGAREFDDLVAFLEKNAASCKA